MGEAGASDAVKYRAFYTVRREGMSWPDGRRRTPALAEAFTMDATATRERTAKRYTVASLDLMERWRILVAGDLVAALVAAVLAITMWSRIAPLASWRTGFLWVAVLPASWMAGSLLLGAYVQPYLHRTVRSWGILVATGALIFAGYSIAFFFAPRALLPRLVVLADIGASVLLVGAWRRLWDWASGHESLRRPIVVVGAGRLGTSLAEILASRPNSGYRVVGFVDDDPAKHGQLRGGGLGIPQARVYGSSEVLPDLVGAKDAGEVVLAFDRQATPELIGAVLACHESGVVVTRASDLFEATTGRVMTSHIGENWDVVLPLAHPGGRAMYLAAKRLVDLLGAAVGLLGFGLALPFLALMIKLDSPGPVLYRQRRTGRAGHTFTIWKLRTMSNDAEVDNIPVWASPSDPRMTRVGRWLRRAHLDELPQLWNVLKGEMSLVGPRPERPEIDDRLEQIIPFYRLRLAVKPGIAGWGAVNGSYVDEDAKAIERLEYDLYYIKHQSLWLDLQIITSAAHRALTVRGR